MKRLSLLALAGIYDAARTLWCERCGAYDIGYAETGERSFCYVQSRRAATPEVAA